MNARLVACAVASLLAAAPLAAQVPGSSGRPISIVFSGGATVPTGSFKEYHDFGFHGDVSVLLRLFGAGIRLRPEITYGRFSVKDAIQSALKGTSGAGTSNAAYSSADVSTLLGAFGNIEFPLVGGLYLLGGVGAVGLSSEVTTSTTPLSETKLSYNGGAGLRFKIGGISGFVEGRLANLAVEKGAALFKDVKTIPVSFGLVF